MNEKTYDVALIGTGIASTMLGSILARAGMKVVLIDKGAHPKFAIGESTVPDTTVLMKLMGYRYGVEEITKLGNFYTAINAVGSGSVGVKRAFSYFLHEEGKPLNPKQAVQMPTTAPPLGPDMHYYRQDVDSYLLAAAIRYGAEVLQHRSLGEIQFGDDGVVLTTQRNETIRARFLVDGASFNSPVAKQLDLRDEDTRYNTNTRSLFTHMVDVKPFDQVMDKSQHGLQYPIHQSTLHHMFPGGWLWVIPFDNHRHATNKLCSVGLTLNRDMYPLDKRITPEEEFAAFLEKYPTIAEQFEDARPVRDWIRSDRIQYSTKQVVGKRWALLPHAVGFIDPLFSAGLSVTCIGVSFLAERLIQAYEAGDFDNMEFSDYEQLVQRNVQAHDRMVHGAYQSFTQGYELWNGWFRVWAISQILGGTRLIRLYAKYLETHDRKYLDVINQPFYNAQYAHSLPEFVALFEEAESLVDAAVKGEMTQEAAAEKLLELFRADFIPQYLRLYDPSNQNVTNFTVKGVWKVPSSFRYGYKGPKAYRTHFGDWSLLTMARATFKLWWKDRAVKANSTVLRDSLRTWNTDWKKAQ